MSPKGVSLGQLLLFLRAYHSCISRIAFFRGTPECQRICFVVNARQEPALYFSRRSRYCLLAGKCCCRRSFHAVIFYASSCIAVFKPVRDGVFSTPPAQALTQLSAGQRWHDFMRTWVSQRCVRPATAVIYGGRLIAKNPAIPAAADVVWESVTDLSRDL